MSVVVTLPQLGESVVEGTIARWLVKEGDRVERDQPLVEVTTEGASNTRLSCGCANPPGSAGL